MKKQNKHINTLICTVGTSLFVGNLKKLAHKNNYGKEIYNNLGSYYLDYERTNNVKEKENKVKLMAKELLNIAPNEFVCGAEINTIQELLNNKMLQLERIIFLVSDTELGKDTGKLLVNYFSERKELNLKKENINYEVIDNLSDNEPKNFKLYGLRNLVRVLGKYIKLHSTGNIAIDATGGYKAQIAIAALMGQALGIPVFYKHELFSEIIDFPPLPISIDYDVLGKYSWWLNEMEKNKTFTNKEMPEEIDEKLLVLLEEVEELGETLYGLSAIGQLYLTTFRARYNEYKNLGLINLSDEKRKFPSFSDHHYPKGFKEYVQKVWEENKWIKTCVTLDYAKQKNIKKRAFYVKEEGNGEVSLIGDYKEDNFGARFKIIPSENNRNALNWAADDLNLQFANSSI